MLFCYFSVAKSCTTLQCLTEVTCLTAMTPAQPSTRLSRRAGRSGTTADLVKTWIPAYSRTSLSFRGARPPISHQSYHTFALSGQLFSITSQFCLAVAALAAV